MGKLTGIRRALRAALGAGDGLLPRGGSRAAMGAMRRAEQGASSDFAHMRFLADNSRGAGRDAAKANAMDASVRSSRAANAQTYLGKRVARTDNAAPVRAKKVGSSAFIRDANKRLDANSKAWDDAYSKMEAQGLPDDEIRRRLKKMGM